jgi:hypothetical protein
MLLSTTASAQQRLTGQTPHRASSGPWISLCIVRCVAECRRITRTTFHRNGLTFSIGGNKRGGIMCSRIAGLAAIAVVLCGPNAFGETITIGGLNEVNEFPFGRTTYVGEYQQIYAASSFGDAFNITQIAFQTGTSSSHPLTSTFNLGLGTTTASPMAPGNNYAANRRPDLASVFSGTVTVPSTGSGSFDFIIPLATPFLYDPSAGNLLLDVFVIHNNVREETGFVASHGSNFDIGRVFNGGGFGPPAAGPHEGLATQFSDTAAPVPEPATLALLGTGLASVAGCRWRRRKLEGF